MIYCHPEQCYGWILARSCDGVVILENGTVVVPTGLHSGWIGGPPFCVTGQRSTLHHFFEDVGLYYIILGSFLVSKNSFHTRPEKSIVVK